MKHALPCFVLALVLTACGSDDKKSTAVAPARTVLGAEGGQAEGVVCPTLNGTYGPEGVNDAEAQMKFRTENNGGRFSYAIADGMPLIKADGQPVRFEAEGDSKGGSVLATCDAESVTLKLQQDGDGIISIRYAPQANGQILANIVNTDGEKIAVTYVRK